MTRVVSGKELEERFGIDSEKLDRLEEDAARGVLHDEPRGEVVRGRPLAFGEKTQQVGFREPMSTIELIDKRAGSLGLKRSDYLRRLVKDDLAAAGMV